MCKADRQKERAGLGAKSRVGGCKRGTDYVTEPARGLSGVWTLKEGRVKVGGRVVPSVCAFRL